MAIYGEDGVMIIRELRDSVASDYILYIACEINNQSPPKIKSYAELFSTLHKLSATRISLDYMSLNNPMSNAPVDIVKFVKTIYRQFEFNCFLEQDFDWINSKDKRLICYIWKLLNHLTFNSNGNEISLNYQLVDLSAFNKLKTIVKMNHISVGDVRKEDIIHFFNRLNIEKTRKEKLIEHVKYAATLSLNHKEVTDWLKKGTSNKVPWLQDYLYTAFPGCIPMTIPGSSGVEYEVISFLDVLCTFQEDKFKLTTIQMKKAWNQKTFREKNKNKKQYSINMSHDIEGILDKISNVRNENKNSIIEMLIRAEYEKISKL